MTDREIEQLGSDGWFSREAWSGAAQAMVAAQLRVDTARLSPARISRAHAADASVRGDSSLWLTAADVDFSDLMIMFETLRCELNRDVWLGLTRFDLQLGYYAGDGACYVRHRDALAGAVGRRLTAIAYLNPGWKPADGGQLRLHAEPAVDLAPLFGRLVVFLSAKVEHEVLPTWAPRLAVTAWYYG